MATVQDAAKAPPPRAWRSPLAWTLLVVLAAGGATADLATKHVAFDSLLSEQGVAQKAQSIRQDNPTAPSDAILHALPLSKPLCCGVRVTLSTNPGVVFGMPMPRGLSVGVTCVTALLILGVFAVTEAKNRLMQVAMGLILAGAIGNLYDRAWGAVHVPGLAEPIRYQVRDFIDCSELTTFGGKSYYPWVFNVADVLLVVGVALPLVQWMLQAKPRKRPPSQTRQ